MGLENSVIVGQWFRNNTPMDISVTFHQLVSLYNHAAQVIKYDCIFGGILRFELNNFEDGLIREDVADWSHKHLQVGHTPGNGIPIVTVTRCAIVGFFTVEYKDCFITSVHSNCCSLWI